MLVDAAGRPIPKSGQIITPDDINAAIDEVARCAIDEGGGWVRLGAGAAEIVPAFLTLTSHVAARLLVHTSLVAAKNMPHRWRYPEDFFGGALNEFGAQLIDAGRGALAAIRAAKMADQTETATERGKPQNGNGGGDG